MTLKKESESKNDSKNQLVWLERCEKPGFFGRSCPNCLFFLTENILDRQVAGFSLEKIPQINWPDDVTE